MKILVVGVKQPGALETSYFNAIKKKYSETVFFDYRVENRKYIKGGKIGAIIHSFLPIEQWIRKMNRDLILKVKSFEPDVIFFFAKSRILFGTLACLKTMYSELKIVWIWPDTPLNLEKYNFENIPFIDLFCTYSSSSVNVFKKMGYSGVEFLPLGADDESHYIPQQCDDFTLDIGFVGGWRPEREKVMQVIVDNFPNLRIGIHGPYWKKRVSDPVLKRKILSNGLFENDLYSFFNKTKININVIDDTNYPAANMRFFEIPLANGFQLASICPEFEDIFLDGEHIAYYKTEQQLITQISHYIDLDDLIFKEIRFSASTLVKNEHTYTNRINQIFSII